jgi:hypothetical protein
MIEFSPIRTKRLSVQLKELSTLASIKLCNTPDHLHELEITKFIGLAVESWGEGKVANAQDLTAQERMFIVTHYLANVSAEGADFSVGNIAKYSDYFVGSGTPVWDPISVGEIDGAQWECRHLTGAATEAIESALGYVDPELKGRAHWVVGALAAQMWREGEPSLSFASDRTAYQGALQDRMKVFAELPESELLNFVLAWKHACMQQEHYFKIDFDDHGIVALPKGGDGEKPLARFRPRDGAGSLSASFSTKSP